jgi:hypothetical protein
MSARAATIAAFVASGTSRHSMNTRSSSSRNIYFGVSAQLVPLELSRQLRRHVRFERQRLGDRQLHRPMAASTMPQRDSANAGCVAPVLFGGINTTYPSLI